MLRKRAPSLTERAHDFWFRPCGADNLGVIRMLLFGYMLYLFASVRFVYWTDVSTLFWVNWSAWDGLGLPPLSHTTLACVELTWKVSLLLACLGLWTRVSTALSAVLGFYLLGLPQNFCKISHFQGLLVLSMAIMAISHCGDGFSLDVWWRKCRRRHVTQSGEYRWPVKMVWMLMAIAFFSAGLSKALGEGWWFTDHLRYQFVQHHYYADRVLPKIGLYVAQSGTLCMLLALGTLVVELLAPTALVSRVARFTVIPCLLLMQVGNAYLLGVHSQLPWLPLYAFWVPWDRLLAWFKERVPIERGARHLANASTHFANTANRCLKRNVIR